MIKKHKLLLLTGLLSLQSCAQPGAPGGPGALNAEVLRKDSYCGENLIQSAASWISDSQTLAKLSERFVRQGKPALPAVDFAGEGVLFIAMGQRPTAGYGLGFKQGSARLRDNTLEVTVSWQEPPPGYKLAQVITSPCLLLRLPAASFQRIQVLDQNGRIRVEAAR